MFQENLMELSRRKPYLLYIYADFCFACVEVHRIFSKIIKDMEDLGKRNHVLNIIDGLVSLV